MSLQERVRTLYTPKLSRRKINEIRLDLASTVVFAAVSYVETKLDIRLMKAQVGFGNSNDLSHCLQASDESPSSSPFVNGPG